MFSPFNPPRCSRQRPWHRPCSWSRPAAPPRWRSPRATAARGARDRRPRRRCEGWDFLRKGVPKDKYPGYRLFRMTWWFMMIYDGLWWLLMVYDDLWRWFTYWHDVLWWFPMISDDFPKNQLFWWPTRWGPPKQPAISVGQVQMISCTGKIHHCAAFQFSRVSPF